MQSSKDDSKFKQKQGDEGSYPNQGVVADGI